MEKHLEDRIKGFIKSQRKESTVQATVCHINKFSRQRQKMSDGSEYEPVTIQSIKCSIERRLREEYYPATISDSLEFNKTRQVLAITQNEVLKKRGTWKAETRQ